MSDTAALYPGLHSSPLSAPASRKPLIALTPYYNLTTNEPYMRPAYPEAIFHAGGIPVTLPVTDDEASLRQLAAAFDAFLFTGGPDIHPFYFHEEVLAQCGKVSPQRDSMELLLLKLAMESQKPILGICRGIQLLNVGLGGGLYQDIPSQHPADRPLAHTQPFAYELYSHTVTVSPHTLLSELSQQGVTDTPQPVKVNSMHHQAIRRLAPGLIASAYASDGVIEAIELPDYPSFFLGVQWHPEYLWKQDETAARLFSRFVRAAYDNINTSHN